MHTSPDIVKESLDHHVIRGCATACIDNAKKSVDLLFDHQTPYRNEALPWWIVTFYVHNAATLLMTAMLHPELRGIDTTGTWGRAMSIFSAQEHISPFITKNRDMFLNLSEKIMSLHHADFDLQDILFGATDPVDSDIFKLADMSWLGELETIIC
jgi:hypothetical protein